MGDNRINLDQDHLRVFELKAELQKEGKLYSNEARSKLKNIFLGKVSNNDVRSGRKIVLKKTKKITPSLLIWFLMKK
ncbi:MAG: hypothetical protein Ct9H90mP22_6600 [Gammaproteobacteria bacterium]|nr:MAG: hypothetical protein Ct9H90mP22_6600 [Gammaproteobacteria bacterium]